MRLSLLPRLRAGTAPATIPATIVAASLATILASQSLAAATPAQIEEARRAFAAGFHSLALGTLIPAAEAGDPAAQTAYATALAEGQGAVQDIPAALALYEAAAAQGDAKALQGLALIYHHGKPGVPADPARAAALYQQALDQGNAAAALGLGLLHASGEGVSKDPGPRRRTLCHRRRGRGAQRRL